MTTSPLSLLSPPDFRCAYEHEYPETMLEVWHHIENDQRPAVLRALAPLQGRFKKILDVGPGDAYYLSRLAPKVYDFIEPNPSFYKMAQDQARKLNLVTRGIAKVENFLEQEAPESYDLVIMSHVLFYMQEQELASLLPALEHKPLVVVHPTLKASVSVEFENYLGIENSRRRVALKEKLLGLPQIQKACPTHFRVGENFDVEWLAFLVAHHTLDHALHNLCRLASARSFVLAKREQWHMPSLKYYEIPQPQIIEFYNLPADLHASVEQALNQKMICNTSEN